MTEVTRTEYRAIALSEGGDHYVGEVAEDPYNAALNLKRNWEVGERQVVIERRYVRETRWVRLA